MNSNNSLLNLFRVSSRTLTAGCWTSTSLRRRPWLGWRTPCWPTTGRTRTSTPWWWRGRRWRSCPPIRSPRLRDFRRWERGHLNPQPSTLNPLFTASGTPAGPPGSWRGSVSQHWPGVRPAPAPPTPGVHGARQGLGLTTVNIIHCLCIRNTVENWSLWCLNSNH